MVVPFIAHSGSVAAGKQGNTFIQPDVPPFEKTLGETWCWIYGTTVALIISYLMFAYSRAWVPFQLHPERPFTKASRLLRSLTRKATGEDTYRQALILLHLAFNKTGHRAVLADDLPEFLLLYPRFRTAEADISRFLAASRRTFFGHDCTGAMREFATDEVVSLSHRLSAAERGLQ
jgi:mxaA protein